MFNIINGRDVFGTYSHSRDLLLNRRVHVHCTQMCAKVLWGWLKHLLQPARACSRSVTTCPNEYDCAYDTFLWGHNLRGMPLGDRPMLVGRVEQHCVI